MPLFDRFFGKKRDSVPEDFSWTAPNSPAPVHDPDHPPNPKTPTAEPVWTADAPTQFVASLEEMVTAKDADRAASLADEQLAKTPQDVPLLITRSLIALDRRDYPLAVKFADRALEFDARSTLALNHRGYARLCEGKFVEAVKDFNRALGLEASFDVARHNLTIALVELEQYDEAIYEATRLSRKGRNRAQGFIRLALVHEARGHITLALEAVRRALDISPNDEWAAMYEVRACNMLGLYLERNSAIRQLRSMNPTPYRLAMIEYLLAETAGDFASARAPLEEMPVESAGKSVVLRLQAGAAAREGRTADALALIEQAMSLVPEDWAHLTMRASLLEILGRDDECIRMLDNALELCPGYPKAVRQRILVACRLGNHGLAKELLSRIEGTEERRLENLELAYLVAFNAGDLDAAESTLDRSVGFRPAAEMSLGRACIHLRRSEWEEARRELDTAIHSGVAAFKGAIGGRMQMHWLWMAGCHAASAELPSADRSSQLTEAMKYYRLSMQAGNFAHPHSWISLGLYPLRELPEFRRLCGQ